MENQKIIEEKVFKLRRHYKDWKRKRNSLLNSLPKTERYRVNAYLFTPNNQIVTLHVPQEFSTSSNIEDVLSFIAKCKVIDTTRRRLLSFNFYKVEKVNAGALSLLLSVIHDLSDLRFRIRGNLPKNKEARQEFVDSGFLEYFSDERGGKPACSNKILVRGKDKTEQVRTAMEIQKAMMTVFGQTRHNQPLQSAIIEMMANSVNHAYPIETSEHLFFFEQFADNKRWYLSVSHDIENKRVYFSFIDNGIGILKTLNRGIFSRIVDGLNPTQILQNAFNGDYRSSTEKKERGRGLPTITDAYEKGAIVDLKIVTNDHLYSFENQTAIKLANNFEGTCYFWILDERCGYGNNKNF